MTEHTPLPVPWRYVTSQIPKHRDAAFIIAANDVFVGKVYGHQGQLAKYTARRICEAMQQWAEKRPHNSYFNQQEEE